MATGSLAQHVQDVVVSAGFNWTSANSLTLDAYRSVTVDQPVAVNGAGAVALETNDSDSGGTLSFGLNGSLSFLGTANSLTINGTAFTLEDSVASLASAVSANPGGSYALGSNYNASRDGEYSGSPITATLTGTVQGLGNAISNLSISGRPKRAANIGLFAEIGPGGTVASITLDQIIYKAASRHNSLAIGALAGLNKGTVANDSASGTINAGPDAAGGLVGVNAGTVARSSAVVAVEAAGAGGLVASNTGVISLSWANGAIKGDTAGGLVMENNGSISQSFATGRVTGGPAATVGGLVGSNGNDGGQINDSYATSSTRGGVNSKVGGFVGENDEATISTSYSTGKVAGGGGTSFVGGFISVDAGSTAGSYWDTTTSGTDEGTGSGNESGLTGLTTAQLQSGLPAGFDSTIWAENPKINSGLPYLINNPPDKK